jgi:hypothetical protein
MPRRPALPKDPSQRAKAILDMATGERAKPAASSASELVRKAGKKGGAARAKSLSAAERSEIASLAAQARWKKS